MSKEALGPARSTAAPLALTSDAVYAFIAVVHKIVINPCDTRTYA